MSPEFLITSLIVVLVPGTGVIYTLSVGMTRGGTASVIAAFGCTLGILPHMAAAILGLAALLHTSALAFQLLKYAGLAYLLYLAWSTLQDKSNLALDCGSQQPGYPHHRDGPANGVANGAAIVFKGILVNILNPKLSIFFVAFLPQFVAPVSPDVTGSLIFLSAVFMLMTFVVFALYGLSAASIRRHLASRPRALVWMRRIFAGTIAALGLKLAFSEID